jgi:ATP-dependent Clp protease adaptor protein ClpS
LTREKKVIKQHSQIKIDMDLRENLSMLPRYKVLLFNDNYHDMDHVVRALLCTILTLSIDDAVRIMLEAHTNGTALVITCPRETAEFYCEGLREFGLHCSIEPQ